MDFGSTKSISMNDAPACESWLLSSTLQRRKEGEIRRGRDRRLSRETRQKGFPLIQILFVCVSKSCGLIHKYTSKEKINLGKLFRMREIQWQWPLILHHNSQCTRGDGTSCWSSRCTPCSSAPCGTPGGLWRPWPSRCSSPGPWQISPTLQIGVR